MDYGEVGYLRLDGIAFGTYPLGPWQKGLVNISKEKGPGGPDGSRIRPRQEHALHFWDLSGFHVGMRRSYQRSEAMGEEAQNQLLHEITRSRRAVRVKALQGLTSRKRTKPLFFTIRKA